MALEYFHNCSQKKAQLIAIGYAFWDIQCLHLLKIEGTLEDNQEGARLGGGLAAFRVVNGFANCRYMFEMGQYKAYMWASDQNYTPCACLFCISMYVGMWYRTQGDNQIRCVAQKLDPEIFKRVTFSIDLLHSETPSDLCSFSCLTQQEALKSVCSQTTK